MVKPVQARQLPRQSSVSLNEDDLNSSDEEPIQQPFDAGLVQCDGTKQKGNINRDPESLQNEETTYVVGGGDGTAQSNLTPNDGSPNTLRFRPPSTNETSQNQVSAPGNYESRPTSIINNQGNRSSRTPRLTNNGILLPSQSSSFDYDLFACDYGCPQGVTPQTALLGRELYLRFLHDEFRITNVRGPSSLSPWQAASLDKSYWDRLNANAQVRQSLRQVVDSFAVSEHRELVRTKAASVDIESLDFNSFQDLLFGLFQEGGITSERVVVLFFFCADLTIRALQEQLTNSFRYLIDWTQLYIVGTFSVWVERHGGWAAVLDQSTHRIYMAAKIGFLCAGIVALCVYIRNAH